MNDKLPTIWPITPHTHAKHELLRRYLGGWFPILSSFRTGRVVVLDGFAGPGIYHNGEQGSPIIALRGCLDHSHFARMNCEFLFLFNEQDTQRFASLEDQVERERNARGGWPANVKVALDNRNFTAMAEDILEGLEGKRLAPTFAFLDPFGYKDVPLETIRKLLAFAKCELFVYFDFNSVNRFATSGVVDRAFTALFGTDEFKDAPQRGPARKQFFHDLYQRQLREVCGFDFVQSFEMINRSGHTGYYLFFCTRNIRGLSLMKEAMWKVAPGGDFRFSDNLHGYDVLFVPEVDTRPLQDALMTRFNGQTVSIEEIEEYTLVSTPYVISHVRRKTLGPLEKAGLITSNSGRRNSFPPGTLVTFA